jgi:hypothetical protein
VPYELSPLCWMSKCPFCCPNGDMLCCVDDMSRHIASPVGDLAKCCVGNGVQVMLPTCWRHNSYNTEFSYLFFLAVDRRRLLLHFLHDQVVLMLYLPYGEVFETISLKSGQQSQCPLTAQLHVMCTEIY